MNKNSIKFSTKLLSIIGGLLLLMGSVTMISFFQFQSALNMFSNDVSTSWNNERQVNALNAGFKQQVQEWKNVLLRGKNQVQREKYWAAFQKKEQEVMTSTQKLYAALPDSKAKTTLGKFATQHAIMQQKYLKGFEVFTNANFDHEKGDLSVTGIDREPAKLLEQAATTLEAHAAEVRLLAMEKSKQVQFSSIFILGLVSVLGLMITLLFCRSVTRLLGGEPNEAAAAMRAITHGDLSTVIKLKNNDDSSLLANLHTMQGNLVAIVSKIHDATETITNAARSIAIGNQDLACRTEAQASSLEETAASMEELTTTVNLNNENEKTAKSMAQSASKVAMEGGTVTSKILMTMKDINESSKRIVDITSVIDGIAFQTNILALNAAVEAARAGQEGQGFAVVAGEVRNLAHRSATAAKEIHALINDSVQKIAAGSKLVDDAGGTMNNVVNNVKVLTNIMENITNTKNEEMHGITQINQALVHLDNITQQNAASVEEAAAAAENMMRQSEQLLRLVSTFKLGPVKSRSLRLAGV